MSDVVYLTVVEVLAFHEVLIEEFGGSPGVRDLGALESALFRPQTGYYLDVVEEAAALLESLVQNHPFVDGSERVAVAVMDVFLRVNGRVLEVDDVEAHDVLIGLMQRGELELTTVDAWLRDRVR
ncbi:MAG: type II toxin-antitoxin system death-on-curing family toxin [Nitriliruptoraceae bacterium]